MKHITILVTGSNGLIGSEAVEYFDRQGHRVVGVDKNMRRVFFGPPDDTTWNVARRRSVTPNFIAYDTDIRDREKIFVRQHPFDVILHCAAQPSHDKAQEIPVLDFEANTVGTLNVLEVARQHARDAIFVFMHCIRCSAHRKPPLTSWRRNTSGFPCGEFLRPAQCWRETC